jgi:hypothetical protein
MYLSNFVGPVREPARAVEAAREALAICKALEEPDEYDFIMTLNQLASAELERTNLAEARHHGEEALAVALKIDSQLINRNCMGDILHRLGEIALCLHEHAQAAALLEASLRAMPSDNWQAMNLQGTLACYEGDYDQANALRGGAGRPAGVRFAARHRHRAAQPGRHRALLRG